MVKMPSSKEERVLLYQFPENQVDIARDIFRALGIRMQILSVDAWKEKVGYLLGKQGFKSALPQNEQVFDFPHRLILLENIRGKRLTKVLTAMEEAGIPHVTYKSAVTPYNTLWTLRYLCEHMAKEHARSTEDQEGTV